MKKGDHVFIANTATVLGDVELGNNVSIWFGAVLRGDSDQIIIGNDSNIQDTAVIHVDPGVPVKIGEGVTIGHGAIVHGAEVGNNTLIGMRATLLNNAVIGDNCIVGANSLITEGKVIPPNSLVMGSPAKVIKVLSSEQINSIRNNARAYVTKGAEYLRGKYE